MCDELSNAIDVDRIPVFRTIYTKFPLIGKDEILSGPTDFIVKMSAKKNKNKKKCTGHGVEIEKHYQNVRTMAPGSVLPMLES